MSDCQGCADEDSKCRRSSQCYRCCYCERILQEPPHIHLCGICKEAIPEAYNYNGKAYLLGEEVDLKFEGRCSICSRHSSDFERTKLSKHKIRTYKRVPKADAPSPEAPAARAEGLGGRATSQGPGDQRRAMADQRRAMVTLSQAIGVEATEALLSIIDLTARQTVHERNPYGTGGKDPSIKAGDKGLARLNWKTWLEKAIVHVVGLDITPEREAIIATLTDALKEAKR